MGRPLYASIRNGYWEKQVKRANNSNTVERNQKVTVCIRKQVNGKKIREKKMWKLFGVELKEMYYRIPQKKVDKNVCS